MELTGIEAGAAAYAAIILGAGIHGTVIWYLTRLETWRADWK
tara:strand:+ start:40 stop:165 length:126 start_codon:yes stop_codon:yes gene_type:complete